LRPLFIGGLLRRRTGRGDRLPWQTGDLQFGSAQPVHQRGIHRRSAQNGVAISMDDKGAWRDNVFVERLWKSIKYE
jgi:transposase InsO family protein